MAEEKLYFDDVNEGDAAPVVSHELTRTDLVMYAGASGDFNPVHHDEVAARAAGLPSVFGHGMYTAGLLATSSDPFQVGHGRDPDVIPGVTRLDTGLRADGRTLVSGHSYRATTVSHSTAQLKKAAGIHFGASAAP